MPKFMRKNDNLKCEINKKEFLRGIGDVTGYVRPSNYYGFSEPFRHRVYIEITQQNQSPLH